MIGTARPARTSSEVGRPFRQQPPVIVAGRVFLAGADDEHRQVYCFDAAGGKLLWQAEVPCRQQ